MSSPDKKIEEIEQLRAQIKGLEEQLRWKESLLECPFAKGGLSCGEVARYSRQMIMPQLTIDGQLAIRKSKVLIVGAGGLGCPAALYLAGAGIGEITLVDHDNVELSNLHRQVLHHEGDVGVAKVESAANKLKDFNSNVKVIPMKMHGDSNSLKKLIYTKKFDVVVDGSDNVPTRYLLNDFCVLNKIPLVSGAALQFEGQLTVYNYKNGPCYRCLYPEPAPASTVTNCGDGGVLGPVPGVIGVLQALEVIKIVSDRGEVLSGRLLMFDATSTAFRNVRLRSKNSKCDVCGENPTITDLINYEQFCGTSLYEMPSTIDILDSSNHIDVVSFAKLLTQEHVLAFDVRPRSEYDMCSLPNTICAPFDEMKMNCCVDIFQHLLSKGGSRNISAFFLCRRGNDSQRAIQMIIESGFFQRNIYLYNVKGGLYAYSKKVDSKFPIY